MKLLHLRRSQAPKIHHKTEEYETTRRDKCGRLCQKPCPGQLVGTKTFRPDRVTSPTPLRGCGNMNAYYLVTVCVAVTVPSCPLEFGTHPPARFSSTPSKPCGFGRREPARLPLRRSNLRGFDLSLSTAPRRLCTGRQCTRYSIRSRSHGHSRKSGEKDW